MNLSIIHHIDTKLVMHALQRNMRFCLCCVFS